MFEIWRHLEARLVKSGEVCNQLAKGVRGVEVACSRLSRFGCLSLRSPCATADSQRTICIIIRTLHLQIKKEKINNRKIKHVELEGSYLIQ